MMIKTHIAGVKNPLVRHNSFINRFIGAPIIGEQCNAVDFDGSTYLSETPITGGGNSKQLAFSLWFYNDNATWQADTDRVIYLASSGGDEALAVRLLSSGRVAFQVRDSSATSIVATITATDTLSNETWHHICGWVDTNTGVQTMELYVDGNLEDSDTPTADALIGTIGRGGIGSGITGSGTVPDGTQLAEVWCDTTETLDFGTVSNIEKFRNSSGEAVGLGSDGSTPTGNQPEFFFSGETATWHNNLGSAAGLTPTGTLTTAASGPPCEAGEPPVIRLPQLALLGVG